MKLWVLSGVLVQGINLGQMFHNDRDLFLVTIHALCAITDTFRYHNNQ